MKRSGSPFSSTASRDEGIALVAALLVIVIVGALVAAGITTAMSVLRSTNSDYPT
jgi:Tfp pilus assembly protein PilX